MEGQHNQKKDDEHHDLAYCSVGLLNLGLIQSSKTDLYGED